MTNNDRSPPSWYKPSDDMTRILQRQICRIIKFVNNREIGIYYIVTNIKEMEIVKYVIKSNDTEYYKNRRHHDEFTKNVMKAATYDQLSIAKVVKKEIESYWLNNGRVYCFLTGKPMPTAEIKKITINIVEEDA